MGNGESTFLIMRNLLYLIDMKWWSLKFLILYLTCSDVCGMNCILYSILFQLQQRISTSGAFQSWSGRQQCDEVCWAALSSPGGRTRLNRSALNPTHYEMAPVKASGSIISSWGIIFRDMLREIPPCASPLAFASPLSSCLLPACPAIYTASTP